MSPKTSLLASLCSVVLLSAASGCHEGSTESTKATQSETHAKRNREMLDYMKNQAKEAPPAS